MGMSDGIEALQRQRFASSGGTRTRHFFTCTLILLYFDSRCLRAVPASGASTPFIHQHQAASISVYTVRHTTRYTRKCRVPHRVHTIYQCVHTIYHCVHTFYQCVHTIYQCVHSAAHDTHLSVPASGASTLSIHQHQAAFISAALDPKPETFQHTSIKQRPSVRFTLILPRVLPCRA